jgi:hypothetical protein
MAGTLKTETGWNGSGIELRKERNHAKPRDKIGNNKEDDRSRQIRRQQLIFHGNSIDTRGRVPGPDQI